MLEGVPARLVGIVETTLPTRPGGTLSSIFMTAGDVSGVILTLDDLSIAAVGRGELERAALLWGAARHLQQSTGTALADYVEQISSLFGVQTPKEALPADQLEAGIQRGSGDVAR